MSERLCNAHGLAREELKKAVVAFGPIMPGFGSWEWIGAEMADALQGRFRTVTFCDEVPECDLVVFVKFRPDDDAFRRIADRSAIIFCPVDGYGMASHIDADEPILTLCDRIVVHCHRLRKYFAPYAETRYLDHHLRFTAPLRTEPLREGPFVWAGVHSNLPPLVEWVNRNPLPEELWVLTNSNSDASHPEDFGFRSDRRVRVERWTPERQREWTGLARAALDVKGEDFRARHKPPVKAFDFIASGVPFATNSWSSPADHLSGLGFSPASPNDLDRWLSHGYFDETVALGRVLQEHLGREQVAENWARLIEEVLVERRSRSRSSVASHEATAVPNVQSANSDLAPRKTKVAILSLLFNWPSTGGGTIHTYEAAKFLSREGYDVRHIYARFDSWGVGQVTEALAANAEELRFDNATWNPDSIRERFRDALERFAPDAVIVTDSWNTKPLLAEAAEGYPYFLRLAALECLCPLNNVRLLVDAEGRPAACPLQQLAEPEACRKCVRENERFSGALHRAERVLAGFDEPDYAERLKRAFENAEGILAVNPAIADMVRPFAKAVHVVPSGFDPDRFDLARLDLEAPPKTEGKRRLFFAGLTQEYMKGFAVLQEACDTLWRNRQDFELVATGEPAGPINDFTRFVGWLSQDDLPCHIRGADILVFPTIAEEALGRSAVEAMGCGRPVVASRIGGLSFTVRDGETGLLFEPGNAADLAEKLDQLLDDPDLCRQLGDAGRRRFEEEYTWDAILARHYRPLLGTPVREPALGKAAEFNEGNPRLGCVLAVQNRPAEVLERTLQSYAFQTLQPADKVLVDFGSKHELSACYSELCREYGWRFVPVGPEGCRWSLSAAYNVAVSRLSPNVNVVFKGDVDVLLGEDVLERAGRFACERLCLFACRTTSSTTILPEQVTPGVIKDLFRSDPPPKPMDGEGIHAYPRRWFEEIGGFDLRFSGWGFEDSDLRLRAEWSIGIHRDESALLLHQWHPRSVNVGQTQDNDRYYQSTKPGRQVVRNGGRLLPAESESDATPPARQIDDPKTHPKVVIATRSLHEELYRLSDEFLDFGRSEPGRLRPRERHRFVGTDAAGYLRELAQLDAEWVINLDEDAFVADPRGIISLIEHMEREGYAACGMPDGGVVPIRRHHPLACNTFFNIFDLRRVRAAWANWDQALHASPASEEVDDIPEIARRTAWAFDRFEPYYGAFFSLLEAKEKILYLDAETWDDGISTILKGPDGRPLLIHCWYSRQWKVDPDTRHRFDRVIDFLRMVRSPRWRPAPDPDRSRPSVPATALLHGGRPS